MKLTTMLLVAAIISGCAFFLDSSRNALSANVERTGVFTGKDDCLPIQEKQLAAGYMTFCGFSGFESRSTVEKKSDAAFGFDYLIQGMKNGKCYNLTHQVVHPPFSPFGKQVITTQKRTFQICGNDQNMGMYANDYLWSFDEEWEKVPGEWSLSVLHEEQILIEEKFIVY
ncbi:MAG: DUF3859 domain-containing protein [Chromatiales bacterium]